MEDRLKELQDQLKQGPLDDKDRKELGDVSHRLADLGLLSIPTRAKEIDDLSTRLKQTQDRITELYAKDAQEKKKSADEDEGGDAKELAQLKKDLDSLREDLEKAGRPIPIAQQIFDAQGEPVLDALPESDKNDLKKHLAEGHRLFTERGCLACHVHESVHKKGDDGVPAVPAAAADFAPDLSRIAAKIAPLKKDGTEVDPQARRRWVVQWVLNPNVYHPRTRMPIMHLTVQQACDVADWLLSQEVKPEELADWKDPELPSVDALVALARVYLVKAPGMTGHKVEEILKLDEVLPKDAPDERTVPGFSADDLKLMTPRRRRAHPGGADRPQGFAGQAGVVRRPQEHRPPRLLRLPRPARLRDGQAGRHRPQRLGQKRSRTAGVRGRRRLRPRTLQHRGGPRRQGQPAPGRSGLALEGRQTALREGVLRRAGAPRPRGLPPREVGGAAQLRLPPHPRLGRPAAYAAVPLRPVAAAGRRIGRGL